jgi:hypothetical protein
MGKIETLLQTYQPQAVIFNGCDTNGTCLTGNSSECKLDNKCRSANGKADRYNQLGGLARKLDKHPKKIGQRKCANCMTCELISWLNVIQVA